jgi:hypothetical protein
MLICKESSGTIDLPEFIFNPRNFNPETRISRRTRRQFLVGDDGAPISLFGFRILSKLAANIAHAPVRVRRLEMQAGRVISLRSELVVKGKQIFEESRRFPAQRGWCREVDVAVLVTTDFEIGWGNGVVWGKSVENAIKRARRQLYTCLCFSTLLGLALEGASGPDITDG